MTLLHEPNTHSIYNQMSEVLCGVDIGGTKCSIALIDYEGKILDKIYTCAHVEEGDEGMVTMVAGM